MRRFFRWLFNTPDPDTERPVTLWIDLGRGAVLVGRVQLRRSYLLDALDKFDGLEHLTLPVEEIE